MIHDFILLNLMLILIGTLNNNLGKVNPLIKMIIYNIASEAPDVNFTNA